MEPVEREARSVRSANATEEGSGKNVKNKPT
jgi:hypothetical protein